ncbi:hypothetical protein [Streptomyces sp. NBC_01217]|uniref:hypothetical protein n=1 Tax=Streptomyces sp. NBC_01217 TaxID=2903779 RepID=UPI002E10457B|nr:hypothetical protein OG507_38545 [Streptomyces sp. NBC_01217]
MSHGVLALGVAVLCISGNVWYLPAVIDLRAGQDRPRSRRLVAAAVLAGWGTAALIMLLLLMPLTLFAVVPVVIAGATATLSLAVRARLRRGREQREEEARWAALFPARTGAPVRPTEEER